MGGGESRKRKRAAISTSPVVSLVENTVTNEFSVAHVVQDAVTRENWVSLAAVAKFNLQAFHVNGGQLRDGEGRVWPISAGVNVTCRSSISKSPPTRIFAYVAPGDVPFEVLLGWEVLGEDASQINTEDADLARDISFSPSGEASRPDDSGYGTMSHSDPAGKRQGVLAAGVHLKREMSPLLEEDGDGDDEMSCVPPAPVSDPGSLPGRADNFASKLAVELVEELKRELHQGYWDRLQNTLAERIQEFAIRIGDQGETQRHRDIMWVAHNATNSIFRYIKGYIAKISIPDEEQEDVRAADDVIDLREKINLLLGKEARETSKVYEGKELREIEIESYRQLLQGSNAFSWLLSTIRRDVELTGLEPVAMRSIREAVLGSFHNFRQPVSRWRKPRRVEMRFVVAWDPLAFLAHEGYHEEPQIALGRVICITGSQYIAQALPCREYMRQTWPSTGIQTLDLIEKVVERPLERHLGRLDDGTVLEAYLEDGQLCIKAMGTPCSVSEMGQQLAWIGAALQCPPDAGGGLLCNASARITDITEEPPPSTGESPAEEITRACCRIEFASTALEMENPAQDFLGQCWYGLFHGFVIAAGFPVPQRPPNLNGLEAPLDMVAGLTFAPKVVEFQDQLCVKGFSTLLYPTKIKDNVICWHLVSNADGRRISYCDDRAGFGSSVPPKKLRYADLEQARHIVGWCDQVKHYAGAPDANLDVEPSWLGRPRSGWALDSVQISGGQYIIVQGSFSFGKKDKPLHVKRDNLDYIARMQWINEKYLIFYDVGDKIAWLVDGPSALLHLVRASIKAEENDDFSHLSIFKTDEIKEPSSTLAYSGRAASIRTLTDEANLAVRLRRKLQSVKDNIAGDFYTFQDRVDEIFRVLEQIIDHQEDNRPNGIGLQLRRAPRHHFEGFDFRDLASRADPYIPKATKLSRDGEVWSAFARELQAAVLFGNGFGDLLRPLRDGSSGCGSCCWNTHAIKSRDLLAVSIKDLERLKMKATAPGLDEPHDSWLLKGDFWWDSPGQAFHDCQTSGHKPGDSRIQTLQHASKRKQPTTSSSASVCKNGAVLFGRNEASKTASLRDRIGTTLSRVSSRSREEGNAGGSERGYESSSSSSQNNSNLPSSFDAKLGHSISTNTTGSLSRGSPVACAPDGAPSSNPGSFNMFTFSAAGSPPWPKDASELGESVVSQPSGLSTRTEDTRRQRGDQHGGHRTAHSVSYILN